MTSSHALYLDSPSRTAYFKPGEASTDQWRHAELSEVMHVRELACVRWEKLWQEPYGHDLKEDAANSSLLPQVYPWSSRGRKGHCRTVRAHLYVPFDCDLASSLQEQVSVAFAYDCKSFS